MASQGRLVRQVLAEDQVRGGRGARGVLRDLQGLMGRTARTDEMEGMAGRDRRGLRGGKVRVCFSVLRCLARLLQACSSRASRLTTRARLPQCLLSQCRTRLAI